MPANVPRSDMARIERERAAVNQQIDAVRQKSVEHSMQLGFVLTAYFYDALGTFEHDPTSLKEAIGDMVYGMDVSSQVGRAKKIAFLPEGSTDVVKRAPRQISVLDQAEIKLMKGDRDGATQLAQHALEQHTGDPARANFILARTALMAGDGETAEKDFQQTIAQTSDPRLLAWSHIYLGRLYDLVDQRDQAITEYKAALTVRDSQPDTKQAAERGLKEPYAMRKKAASTADTQHPQ
jgi:tetratricopeptide (TPR) repeat protein